MVTKTSNKRNLTNSLGALMSYKKEKNKQI